MSAPYFYCQSGKWSKTGVENNSSNCILQLVGLILIQVLAVFYSWCWSHGSSPKNKFFSAEIVFKDLDNGSDVMLFVDSEWNGVALRISAAWEIEASER